MNKHLFWIASYPKSGNTLVRAILSSLFFSDDGKFDFKMLKNIPIIEDTANLEFIKMDNYSEYKSIYKLKVLSKYWSKIQSKKNLDFNGDFMFVKTHHALIKIDNYPYTTSDYTRGIIYVVRDPRDVVLSMANHLNISIERSLKYLINENFSIKWQDNNNLFLNQTKPPVFVSNWENHFLSWNDKSFNSPKLIIKYEDLIENKYQILKIIVNFFSENFGFKFSNLEQKLNNIIEQTDFNILKEKEKIYGFDEAVNNKKFFNVGKQNQWLKKLSKKEIMKIEEKFFPIMKKLNYKLKFYESK